MRSALFVCELLFFLQEEVFIKENQLALLKQMWIGMPVGILWGLWGCSFVHVLLFSCPGAIFWCVFHQCCLHRICDKFLVLVDLVVLVQLQKSGRMGYSGLINGSWCCNWTSGMESIVPSLGWFHWRRWLDIWQWFCWLLQPGCLSEGVRWRWGCA